MPAGMAEISYEVRESWLVGRPLACTFNYGVGQAVGGPIRKSSANPTFPCKLGIIRVSIFHPPCFSAELLSGLPAVVPGLWPGSGIPPL